MERGLDSVRDGKQVSKRLQEELYKEGHAMFMRVKPNVIWCSNFEQKW